MAELSFRKIEKEIKSFDCGNPSINCQIREAYYPHILNFAYTFQVSFKDKIVGYYMIKFLSINICDCPEPIKSFYVTDMDKCCTFHIGFLAVNKGLQKQGIGSAVLTTLIADARRLSRQYPLLLITIDALKEKYEWYRQRGFRAFDEKAREDDKSTIRMYIDCVEDRDVISRYIDENI